MESSSRTTLHYIVQNDVTWACTTPSSSTQTKDCCWLSTYGYIYMWPTCLPDTSDGSGMETTCTRTSARLVCVCQGTTSTVILSVVFVNVGQCGWSSGAQAPCDDMLHVSNSHYVPPLLPQSHHQLLHTKSTTHVSCLNVNWPWMKIRDISNHLLKIDVPTKGGSDFNHPFIPHFNSRNSTTELGLVWHLTLSC